jgi:hypothetical protein
MITCRPCNSTSACCTTRKRDNANEPTGRYQARFNFSNCWWLDVTRDILRTLSDLRMTRLDQLACDPLPIVMSIAPRLSTLVFHASEGDPHTAQICSKRPHNAKTKTYNSGYSLLVTHATTNPPVHCLYMAERTGSLVFSVLWSYVEEED